MAGLCAFSSIRVILNVWLGIYFNILFVRDVLWQMALLFLRSLAILFSSISVCSTCSFSYISCLCSRYRPRILYIMEFLTVAYVISIHCIFLSSIVVSITQFTGAWTLMQYSYYRLCPNAVWLTNVSRIGLSVMAGGVKDATLAALSTAFSPTVRSCCWRYAILNWLTRYHIYASLPIAYVSSLRPR